MAKAMVCKIFTHFRKWTCLTICPSLMAKSTRILRAMLIANTINMTNTIFFCMSLYEYILLICKLNPATSPLNLFHIIHRQLQRL